MGIDIEKIIEEIIQDVLVDYVVEKVIEKLEKNSKRALVIFTGATIGFEKSIQSLKRLKDNGWKLEVVLSKAADNVLTESVVKKLLDLNSIIKEGEDVDAYKLVDESNVVIIPTLTINSCSKIVNCISDSIATNIVSYALMKGKKVVASVNACCPDNQERISLFGDNLSPVRKEMLRNNLIKLKEHGIIIVKSENIDSKVEKNLKSIFKLNNQVDTKCCIGASDNEVYLDKKIISRIDIYENRTSKNIRVNKNSIVTDIAREEALRLKINLLK